MNKVIEKEDIKIEDIIYDIRKVQVMLDSEISKTKCHNHLYYEMITHYATILMDQYQYYLNMCL